MHSFLFQCRVFGSFRIPFLITRTLQVAGLQSEKERLLAEKSKRKDQLAHLTEVSVMTSRGFAVTSRGFVVTSSGFVVTSRGFVVTSRGFIMTSRS